MSEFKEVFIAIFIVVLIALSVPWAVRLIDMWVVYKNWVLEL